MLACMEGESLLEGELLDSVYQFDYLECRSLFTSDGDDAADMRHRMFMTIAGERSRGLDYLWFGNRLPGN